MQAAGVVSMCGTTRLSGPRGAEALRGRNLVCSASLTGTGTRNTALVRRSGKSLTFCFLVLQPLQAPLIREGIAEAGISRRLCRRQTREVRGLQKCALGVVNEAPSRYALRL